MKLILFVIAVLLLFVVLTLLAMSIGGTVLIALADKTIQFPLVYLVLGGIVLFAIGYALIRLMVWLRQAPVTLGKKRKRGRFKRSRDRFKSGVVHMVEGNWSRAERELAESAKTSDLPVLSHLAAARSAQESGHTQKRDEHLLEALKADSESELAVGITRAELLQANEEFEEAGHTLSALIEKYPANKRVQKLLARNLVVREDYWGLHAQIDAITKNETIGKGEKRKMVLRCYRNLFRETAKAGDRDTFDRLWKSVPKVWRDDVSLVKSYIKQLIRFDDAKTAGPFMRKFLSSHWNDEIVAMYSELTIRDPKIGLRQTEKWLREHPNSPGLLATAGFLNARVELWGKARSLLEQSLAIKPAAQTYKLLGDVLLKMGEAEAASESYRAGLAFAVQETES